MGTIGKILWHSVFPEAGTGYAQQTKTWVPRIASLGYEVAISSFSGISPGISINWTSPQGTSHRVYPGGKHKYGADVLPMHAGHFGADLVITLMDTWALTAEPLIGVPAACWSPIDSGPKDQHGPRMPKGDLLCFQTHKAIPIAVSRWGAERMLDAGLDPIYVPHGIDTGIYAPRPDRDQLRELFGVTDKFVIGIFGTNMGFRKAWIQQLRAFAKLHRKHPDTVLIAHTSAKPDAKEGTDIEYLSEDLGIPPGVVRITSQYHPVAGLVTDQEMAGTMNACDLVSNCSMGGGFELVLAEAEACGIPTVATRWSAMPEVSSGWLVGGEPFYVGGHRAWWLEPDVGAIWRAYEAAYARGPVYKTKKANARKNAMRYDAGHVLETYWKPALKEIEARLG